MTHWILKLFENGDSTDLLGPYASAASLSLERHFTACPAVISLMIDGFCLFTVEGVVSPSSFSLSFCAECSTSCYHGWLLFYSLPISFFPFEPQSWTHHARCGLMRAVQRGTTTFLKADPLNAWSHNVYWHGLCPPVIVAWNFWYL